MRILLIGPDHTGGSLSPYLAQLSTALKGEGATVDRLSSHALPYDSQAQRFLPIERILETADGLLGQVDLSSYDLLSVHFGNLELEQLLPVLWSGRARAPAVYHVHTIVPTLLIDHVPAGALHSAVLGGIRSMDGLVYFGHYAQRRLGDQHHRIPSEVAWWPTTIPVGTQPQVRADLGATLDRPAGLPIVSVYGFASPWKSAATLIQAAENLDRLARIVLAGPFWDDPAQAGVVLCPGITHLSRQVELAVVPTYLGPGARLMLLRESSLGVFPYQDHASFQGSGAIADYLGAGVPVIATDVANMAEVIGSGGLLVRPNDPKALLEALSSVLGDNRVRIELRAIAGQRIARFLMGEHARRCLAFYRRIAARQPRMAPR